MATRRQPAKKRPARTESAKQPEPKRGTVKYADPDKGYGYIIADDATDPSDATLFEISSAVEAADLKVGTPVEFEVDEGSAAAAATNVKPA